MKNERIHKAVANPAVPSCSGRIDQNAVGVDIRNELPLEVRTVPPEIFGPLMNGVRRQYPRATPRAQARMVKQIYAKSKADEVALVEGNTSIEDVLAEIGF